MDYPNLTFEKVDTSVFTNLQLAFDVLREGGTAACALNAANEVAVEAFLQERISFLDIFRINSETISKTLNIAKPQLKDYILADKEARKIAAKFI